MAEDPELHPKEDTGGSTVAGLLDLGFLTHSTEDDVSLAADGVGERAGDFIDRYRLLNRVGEGGFGFVWRVEQTQPFHRELALKLVKPGMDSREIIARFQSERQALALMDHPNIAAVLDAGTTSNGRPYFVMELVKGSAITDYCDEHKLGLRERLELFIPVCQAVQHAHQKAILHRDLKPSNLLVTEVEGRPVPKVIDFGIAKALGAEDENSSESDSVLRTRMGMVVGTPRYMSPEQAGSMPDVDTRSDVYALGVVLCELLTSCTPFPAEAGPLPEVLRQIRDAEPVRPSALVQEETSASVKAAANRGLEPARLARALKGDLDWIVLKALEKDRSRRYATPLALADDLQRHLDQQPVTAAAPTWHYQLGKFARRHRGALVSTSLVAVALIGGTIVSLWQAAQAEKSRAEAEANYHRAREAVDLFLSRVTSNPRMRDADFQDLQLSLLGSALPYFEEMSRQGEGDARLLTDKAWAYSRIAHIYRFQADFAKADENYRKAIAIGETVVAGEPQNSKRRQDLASWLNSLGVSLEASGKPEEACKCYDRALELFRSVIAEDPGIYEAVSGLSIALTNRGVARTYMGRHNEAGADFEEAKGFMEKLVAARPSVAEHQQQLATCLTRLADYYTGQSQLTRAEVAFRRADELIEKVCLSYPSDRDYRRNQAAVLQGLGECLCLQGKAVEGIAKLRRSVAVQQSLRNDFPNTVSHREQLAYRLSTLGDQLVMAGRRQEAVPVWHTMRAEQERLVKDFPGNASYSQGLALTLFKLAEASKEKGDLPQAVEFSKLAVAIAPNPKYQAFLRGLGTAPPEPAKVAASG
ncbi:MAG TPA: serine/threonine-protein kinase, partial [Verrucomicrobium sp.]|nr:serine/threonine-protein kinase [Verrucomicrobium sp.]